MTDNSTKSIQLSTTTTEVKNYQDIGSTTPGNSCLSQANNPWDPSLSCVISKVCTISCTKTSGSLQRFKKQRRREYCTSVYFQFKKSNSLLYCTIYCFFYLFFILGLAQVNPVMAKLYSWSGNAQSLVWQSFILGLAKLHSWSGNAQSLVWQSFILGLSELHSQSRKALSFVWESISFHRSLLSLTINCDCHLLCTALITSIFF